MTPKRSEDPSVLEPEFQRIGTTGYEAFREFVNRNLPPAEQIPFGEGVNLAIDVPGALRILHSLPDGAGAAAFADAMIREFQEQMRQFRRPDSGGAGA